MKQVTLQVVFLAAASVPTTVFGQATPADPAYPSKPIRFVVPFPPGGGGDTQARLLAEKLTQRFGQQVMVDNRPGASSVIGMEIVARAPGDGYTIVQGAVGSWAVNPHLYKLSFDVLKDFAPIIHVSTTPAVLVVHPSLPVKSVKEFIALAKQKPGQLNYGSSGAGSIGHISSELFASMTQIKMMHVSYKGAVLGMVDLLRGEIGLMFNSAVLVVPHIQSGKLRAVAVTSAKRMAALPDLPTIAETVPGYENTTWQAIGAPARTPPAVVARLNKEINAILQMSDIQARLAVAGSTATGGTPEQFHDYLKAELAKYGKLIKETGLKIGTGN